MWSTYYSMSIESITHEYRIILKLGVAIYLLISGINYTVDMGTGSQKMVLITGIHPLYSNMIQIIISIQHSS